MREANRPWNEWVERVLIQTPFYVGYDGEPSTGGRERYIRDLGHLIQKSWGRPVVIVQMGNRDFETTADGFPVVAKRSFTRNAAGDPPFSWWLTRRFARPGDAILNAAGEHGWPFFRPGSKGVQHGVWWDGPMPVHKRLIQRQRMFRYLSRMRSVLCVDTNTINWFRARGRRGGELAARCRYIPNYADLDRLPVKDPGRAPGQPLRLLFARRFARERGPMLFLDALAELARRRFPFHATICAVGGVDEVARGARERGISQQVTVGAETLDGILARYADADVSVVPTVWAEGTSFAAVESICAGVPVVTTPVGGLANLVVPGFNGQVASPDPKGLADAIASLADETTWRRMRQNCLAMRPALGMDRWKRQVLEWVKA